MVWRGKNSTAIYELTDWLYVTSVNQSTEVFEVMFTKQNKKRYVKVQKELVIIHNIVYIIIIFTFII